MINDTTYQIPFLVIDRLQHDMIIGRYLLQDFRNLIIFLVKYHILDDSVDTGMMQDYENYFNQ